MRRQPLLRDRRIPKGVLLWASCEVRALVSCVSVEDVLFCSRRVGWGPSTDANRWGSRYLSDGSSLSLDSRDLEGERPTESFRVNGEMP